MQSLLTSTGKFCRRAWCAVQAMKHFEWMAYVEGPRREANRNADLGAWQWLKEAAR